jgi:hypothetical protein
MSESLDRPAAPDLPRWAEWLTRVLDDGIPIPGTSWRVGLDPILGALLPGAGDAMTAVGTVAILALAWKRRVPTRVLGRMVVNILVDVIVGAVPVIGDLVDFVWHSNRKNLELLREHGGEARPTSGTDVALLAGGTVVVVGSVIASIVASLALLGWLAKELLGS